LAQLGIVASCVGIAIALITCLIYGTFQLHQLAALGTLGSSGSIQGSKGLIGINGAIGEFSSGKNGNNSNGTNGIEANITSQKVPAGNTAHLPSGTSGPTLPKSGLFS
jgi:hypothetical protein